VEEIRGVEAKRVFNKSWQDFKYVNGTLEEWIKKSDAELAAIEDEIRQIRELLSEEDII
jgi:Skp family chaperone for outer membrane proteins